MAGTPKWWDVSVTPIMGSDARVERILVTSRDITEQKRAEAQQRLLNHELGHRLKNMLAMIQAVANQTLRRATSLTEASAAFDSRLIALGKAQDVLTDTQWKSAEINSIIRNALAPHGIDSGRFTLAGQSLILSSRCSLALSLALHELATNAMKYGALSVDGGSVAITWNVREQANDLRFNLEWREIGGPAVNKPERTGFGSFMIERSLSAYFKGAARIEYAPGGVLFTLDAPATRVEAEFQAGKSDILASKVNIN
jgi:two-component sensor histidine kinase